MPLLLLVTLIAFAANPAGAFQPVSQNDSYEILLPAFDLFGHDGYDRDIGGIQAEHALAARYGGNWRVHSWNPQTGTPHFVYGTAPRLSASIADASALESLARQVIAGNAEVLGAELENLRLTDTPHALGKWAVHYQQTYNGMDVWGATVRLVFSDSGKLMLMGSDYHSGIDLDPTPAIDEKTATEIARADLPFDPATDRIEGTAEMLVLPYPLSEVSVEHHLVWRIRVRTEDPLGAWVTHVDAHNGTILWRFNDIHFAYGGTSEQDAHDYGYCDGDVETQAMHYLNIDVDGIGTATSDIDGNWSIDGTGGSRYVSCDVEGPYCHVYENVAGPEATFGGWAEEDVPLTVRFDDMNAQRDERDVFDAVSDIHDFFQLFAPEFTYAHNQINARVSIDAGCNAYYDGNINFYRERDGCANTGELQQVVHHEYGHGVQAVIIGGQGNEGLGEGNADILGNLITQDSVIGRGFTLGNCAGGIRDSDNNLIYPDHVVGQEIHFAGQVIAGFNWDAMILLQDMYGGGMNWDGLGTIMSAERWHYGRVLMDPEYQPDQVLATFVADDDDGDLSNGTPHHAIFCEAAQNHNFDCPEILFGVVFEHTPRGDTMDTENPYPVSCTVYSTEAPIDPSTVKLFWRVEEGLWNEEPMLPTGGDDYAGEIPSQQGGVIDYYLYAEDTSGLTGTEPDGAPVAYHSFLIAWMIDDMESANGWSAGFPGDDATGGIWEWCNPNGTIAQPEDDHTANGALCWVTGQHPGGAPGLNDVDNGSTTLLSPIFNLEGALSTNVRYWKWFSNDRGPNPGAGLWDVYVSNNGGSSWERIEHTLQSTNAWVSFTFDMADVFPGEDPNLLRMRFVASDIGEPSLVEGAIDDIVIQAIFEDLTGVDGDLPMEFVTELDQNVPNPFNPRTEIRFTLDQSGPASLRIFDAGGRLVRTLMEGELAAGEQRVVWDGKADSGQPLASGVYFYRLETAVRTLGRRMVLIK